MIRPYQNSDLPFLLEIFRKNMPKFFAPEEEPALVGFFNTHGSTYFIIENDGRICGGCGYIIREAESLGVIAWIFFDPDFQGQGMGRSIVEHCLDRIRTHANINKVIVRTSQHAWQFFAKFGFELIRTEDDFWAEGLHLYFMEMDI